MSSLGHASYIDYRPKGVRCNRASNKTRPRGKQWLEIVEVQAPVLAHVPPAEHRALLLQSHPGCDVGLVVQIAYDDLPAVRESLTEREAHQANEGCRIHAEGDLVRVGGVQERGDSLPGAGDFRIYLPAFAVAAPALDVAPEQMRS